MVHNVVHPPVLKRCFFSNFKIFILLFDNICPKDNIFLYNNINQTAI